MLQTIRGPRVPVPNNLSTVTRIAQNNHTETPASHVDLNPKRLDAAWKSIEGLYKTGAFPGISICIRKHNAIVLNRSIGHARIAKLGKQTTGHEDMPMMPETPVCLFSASKAINAILMFKLIEDQLVTLTDPVAQHLPEFGQNGKQKITIGQVLSHRSSVPWYKMPLNSPPEAMGDWDKMVADICAMKKQVKPGVQAYHAFTGGFILGEIIQRITGLTPNEYLHKHIAKPMEMENFTFGVPKDKRAAIAYNYTAGDPVRWPVSKFIERALSVPFNQAVELSNSDAFLDATVPAGNLYATAEEVSRFYGMLLNNGQYQQGANSVQILKPETVAAAVKPAAPMSFDRTLMMPMRYSHGMMLGSNPAGMYGINSGKAYGHIGFMNVFGWADPSRDISVGLLVTGKALIGSHLISVGKFLTDISWNMR